MAGVNYLIGRGELLSDSIDRPLMKPNKAHPYEVDEARARLAPQLAATVESFDTAGAMAPDGVYVAKFALHPAYVAKSYSPQAFFRRANLEALGSRDRLIEPQNEVRKNPQGLPYTTSEVLVAGTRDDFAALTELLQSTEPLPGALEIIREFEEIAPFTAAEKVRPGTESATAFEIVLHLPSTALAPNNVDDVLRRASALGLEMRTDMGFLVGGLLYLPAKGNAEAAVKLADITTVRVIRPMPGINVSPVARSLVSAAAEARLPTSAAVRDGELKVAILDGGLPPEHALEPWVASYREMDPAATNVPGYAQHGLAVTSAYLFGPLLPGVSAPTPPSKVSVFRVLDSRTESEDAFELYRTLGFVEEILLSRAFDFINLSLGPALPIDDTEVHAWTALIDELLRDGSTLLTVAAGNNGGNDWASGNARVQVPSDAVNALTVGAYSIGNDGWDRAPYSAIGPGRSPGLVKPDIVAFGGDTGSYFHVVSEEQPPTLLPTAGTSLAAPLALRFGATIRAVLGGDLEALAIRALTIHGADASGLSQREVGWGRIADDPMASIASTGGTARIVYQGELRPGKYVRARVPLPEHGLEGKVRLTATFCFASPVDNESPDTYTKAGLEARFRPDLARFDKGSKTPRSRAFFSSEPYADEASLRAQSGKWETVMHGTDRMEADTLREPVFDIHYMARDDGGESRDAEILRYALVITIEAPQVEDLHGGILAAYPGILVPIEPVLEIDVSSS